jgi:hypothetical protein
MLDSLTITILLIILTALIGAFSSRVKRDKCLYDFNNDPVTLEKITGKVTAKGILKVESTGLEFIYPIEKINPENNLLQTSFLFYKYEYPQILALIRFQDELSEDGKKKRNRDLKRVYKPSIFRRTRRRMQNIFKTLSDSLKEVGNALLSHFQKGGSGAAILKSQDKYLKQINQNLVESVGSSYDKLLEKYIGHKIVFDMIKGEKVTQYSGILKDYTAKYLEILDVQYAVEDKETRLADIIVPQTLGIVRHLGEKQHESKLKSLKNLTKWIKPDTNW